MTDEEFFSATPELTAVYQWARARYAAPWAVFGAVLLRVSASTGPEVQLPGIIGGRASLNLLAAFVSPSGGGKGISDKVAREVWPAPIIERPIGSGEGIAATFMPPKKEGQEAITRAIFSVPEIDTLAGIAGRQGSILLAQLKSMAMGELLGQSNASDATTRIVQAHTYRCCLSVGAQPGHCGVIFSDTSGGTPQRFLWFPTTDPDMPATPAIDPGPLNTALPSWARASTDVVEIQYGPEEIAQTVIAAHIARQRGDSEALDGHALLTRCKVAAVLAVMHHRMVVSELDWQLSESVMAMSDRTRDWILSEAKRAERAKVRDKAIARAAGEDFYDASRLETVKRSIMRMLERDGEQAGGDLRRRLGKREKRELFDQAIALLEGEGLVCARPGEHNSMRYRIGSPVTNGVTPRNTSSEGVTTGVTRDHPATVTDLDSRRSHDSDPPKLTGRAWLANHLAALRAAGHTTAESFAVLDAGEAAGFARQTIRVAASDHPDITVIGRNGKVAVWDITGTRKTKHTSAADWTANYLDNLTRDGIDLVDKEKFRHAATAAGYSWTSARHAATDSGRIESVPGTGSETIWKIVQPADAEDAS
ncbi:hypothetical protein A5746_01875 [Mycolicibacterium conceptionense]|uniref:hypothetical protein n=1 Tax=Mycolicibacterium TaxID=1866885 RepID=UPI0007ED8147|nr:MULTISPECIES: hypothetical protein [Mycolicibacterium]OBJ95129.1 hypothetical protein A5638_21540 [Mycolicibacterium fortuitum]OBK59603.1 hypothetical protein A5654_31370 [Mycolicibacterium fortuitum]OMB95207.1 hypothetical protein A5746_01875 [Mycolicibacterium conceptionense]